ncbi:glutamine synthetase family protein [Anaerotruncus colihominis]|uniref:glutamine synthetase family protein n=1 Tax=Anaerotruncus colihominis TaxID=169435 RepID=UPI00189997C0|nr:glutamine synthetase family protein [Anaerotruncus colihominis]
MHMNQTSQDVLQFVAENDVKFIRLAFCDLSGFQKNIAIQSSELLRAFEEGISFDASAAGGFAGVEDSDLFLVPDPATLSVLPWRPAQGRVARMFCGIVRPDGAPYDADARALLKQAARRAAEMGYSVQVGAECEFYLFETDEYDRPTMIPHDRGGYCDIAPLDRGENIRREICLTLESLGMRPESSHHEQGPGQNEVDFRYTGALTAADHLLGFKAAVKSIAAQSGLYASFLPKPFLEYSGSGLHINLSLFQDGKNLFAHGAPEMDHFMAGLLAHACDITAFLNPLTNSYARFGAFEAPKYATWSRGNRSQLIRIPAARGEYSRIELRSPDPACNPYLALALIIHAGLDGIADALPLTPPVDINLYDAEPSNAYPLLPRGLGEAAECAAASDFNRRHLPAALLRRYCEQKRREAERMERTENCHQTELKLYFDRV